MNSVERLYYISVMLFGVLVFGFLGGTLAAFIGTLDEIEADQQKELTKMALVHRIKDDFDLDFQEFKQLKYLATS